MKLSSFCLLRVDGTIAYHSRFNPTVDIHPETIPIHGLTKEN